MQENITENTAIAEQTNHLLNHLVSVEKELEKFAEISSKIEELKERKTNIGKALQQLLPSADFLTQIDRYQIKVKTFDFTKFNSATFKTEHPDLYTKYTETKPSIRVTISPIEKNKEAK